MVALSLGLVALFCVIVAVCISRHDCNEKGYDTESTWFLAGMACGIFAAALLAGKPRASEKYAPPVNHPAAFGNPMPTNLHVK